MVDWTSTDRTQVGFQGYREEPGARTYGDEATTSEMQKLCPTTSTVTIKVGKTK